MKSRGESVRERAQTERAEAPIINFSTGRKAKKSSRKTANRGIEDEVDANDELIEVPEEDPNKISPQDIHVDENEVEDDNLPPASSTALSFNPVEEEGSLEMVEEINTAFAGDADLPMIQSIVDMRWKKNKLLLKTKWNHDNYSWQKFEDMKIDLPVLTAYFIVKNYRGKSCPELVWARQTVRDYEVATRRLKRAFGDDLTSFNCRRTVKRRKKFSAKKVFKYGIQVPRNVREALELDKLSGTTHWEEAIKKEVGTLVEMDCFEFKPSAYEDDLDDDFQRTTLNIIFDVKQDLRRKARMVAGGHLVEASEHDIYSSTVKGISVKLLHVIAHKQGLKQLCGDVGNAYINAYTNEKVYARAGPEFGTKEGSTVIIKKALYGLKTSSERWYAHFADTLRSFGFWQSRYDRDVWMRKDEENVCYEYICTHVDDFMIVSMHPEKVMEQIQGVYTVKSVGPPDYYLGNDYKKDRKGRWMIGCKKYLKEAISRVDAMFGEVRKYSNPTETGDEPELDDSELLGEDDHRKFQMLIGMLVWIVTIGRFDVAYATSSLSRFTAAPRKGHLDRVLRVFGYLKKRSNRRIMVDSDNPVFTGEVEMLDHDYSEEFMEQYPDAHEEIDAKLPEALVDEMAITVFVDSDHAHDKVTRRSITGIIMFVGRTPVFYSSKRQGSIETSTYGAEFCAMKTCMEELIALRYMLRCLGVKVEHASLVCGDNMGVIQNVTIKDSLLKKKHVAISYHKARECVAAGIAHPMKTKGKNNFADVFTKGQTHKDFSTLVGGMMWG